MFGWLPMFRYKWALPNSLFILIECDMMCWNQRYLQKSSHKENEGKKKKGIQQSPVWWGEQRIREKNGKNQLWKIQKGIITFYCQMFWKVVMFWLFMETSSINEASRGGNICGYKTFSSLKIISRYYLWENQTPWMIGSFIYGLKMLTLEPDFLSFNSKSNIYWLGWS